MKKRLGLLLIILSLVLTGCSKKFDSPEEVGQAYFDFIFSIYEKEEVDIEEQCNLIVHSDFVERCIVDTLEIQEFMLEEKSFSKDSYELIEIRVRELEQGFQEVLGLGEYDLVYLVTIEYGVDINGDGDTRAFIADFEIFVAEIDGSYKRIMIPTN